MKDTVTAIDIGTTKVAVLLCQRSYNDNLGLSGFGQVAYEKAQNDEWKSDKVLVPSLKTALGQASKMAGVKVSNCTVGIPSEYCGLVSNRGEISLDKPITRQDTMSLRKQVVNYSLPAPWKISDVIYGNYLVDGMPVSNPVGLSCKTLELEANIICIDTEFIRQITHALNSLQINVESWLPVPIVSAKALLTDEERQKGTLFIDVGGESIDLTIYKENIPVFLDWIPLGGNAITRDIATSVKVSYEEAEKLKRFCVLGLALRDDPEAAEMNLPIREGKEIFNVPMELLQRVVEARADEMLDLVEKRIADEGLKDSYNSIILTGGGLALFRGIREFAFKKMNVPISLGVPDVIGLSGPTHSAVYAIGLAGLNNNESASVTTSKVLKALIRKIKEKLKL